MSLARHGLACNLPVSSTEAAAHHRRFLPVQSVYQVLYHRSVAVVSWTDGVGDPRLGLPPRTATDQEFPVHE